VQAVKQAFRRAISRYHPDKVTHLGREFQQIASTRAAELTAAYNTLSHPHARAEYDALLDAVEGDGAASSPIGTPQPASEPAPEEAAASVPVHDRFGQERANRDQILRRAVLARVQEVLQDPQYEQPQLSGFDLSFVPRQRSGVFRRGDAATVLVRLADTVDRTLAMQAWTDAIRARINHRPVALLLMGRKLQRASELTEIMEDRQRKHPKLADAIYPIALDVRDWTAQMPPGTPPSIRTLLERLRNFAS
jgi:hypothetical protein